MDTVTEASKRDMDDQPAVGNATVDMATPAGEQQQETGQEKHKEEATKTAEASTSSSIVEDGDTATAPAASDKPSSPAKTSEQQPSEGATAHDDQPAKPSEEKLQQPEEGTSTVKPENTNSIQEGYVLVVHPDAAAAAGPSGTINSSSITNGINNNTSMPASSIVDKASSSIAATPHAEPFLQDHIDDTNINDEHGQEVEHYDPNTPPARIQAYARLEFPFFNFYIQKLSVTIGRRPPVSRGASVAPSKLVQAGGVDINDKPAAEEAKEPAEAKEAAETTKTSPKPEEGKDTEVPFTVKKEEEEKDEQHPATSVEPPAAEPAKEPTVKPEETPRKMGTCDDRQQADAVAGPSTATGGPSGAPQGTTKVRTAAESSAQPQVSTAETSQAQQSQSQAESSSKSDKNQVDVDLGPIKAVSRNHARLFFDDTINTKSGLTNSWSLEVKGRNGLVLDGKWRAKGEIARLRNGSRIQIAERIFHFVLPNGVGYPTAPPSPVMDEYYEGQPYGYPPTPDRSQSPIIYGSDSEELRSDNDDYGYGYDDEDDMDVDGSNSAHRSTSGGPRNTSQPKFDENGKPIKRKRGRPKKERTAEQMAALELERQRRLDPTIPRRPRGRPPKHKKDENAQQHQNQPQQYTPIQPQPPPIAGTGQQQQPQSQTQPQQQQGTQQQPSTSSQPSTSTQGPKQKSQPQPIIIPTQLQPIPYASARASAPDIPVPPLVPLGNSLPPGQQQSQMQQGVPPPPIPLGGLDENGKPRLSKKEQADLRKAQKQAEKEEKQRIKEAEKKAREEAKAAAKEAKAREIAEKKRKDEERKKAAAEEAKRMQEERQKAAERDKAEKERQKLAAAAAAAELKAKTIADAQAKAKADAEARAAREAESKAKLGGVAGNEVKIRPAPAPQANAQTLQPPPAKKASQPKQQTPSLPPQQPSQTPAPQTYVPTNQFQGKPEKPPYSYPALIAQAIWSAPNRQAPLQHIHLWIPDKYPFFRDPAHAQILAQAIKQNLAVNRAFVNIPLPSGVALWAIEPEQAKLFDGNTFLPPPNAQSLPYHAPPPIPPQHYYQPPVPAQPQPLPQQHIPIQPHPQPHIPLQQQQHQQMYSASPAPMMSPPIHAPMQRTMNGMAASASPAPVQMPAASIPPPSMPAQQPIAPSIPSATASPAPPSAPAAVVPAASTSTSSKMPILIARPSASYSKPAPPTSAAANDPTSMLDSEGYPPIAIHEGKMYLSPVVFGALTAQQFSNLQSIETKQALNILQAFVVNYFKVELKKRKKAEKAALKNASGLGGTSASPSPAPSGMKRQAADDPMGGNEPKIQRVS